MPNPEPPYIHEYDSLHELDAASLGKEPCREATLGTIQCVLKGGARIQITVDKNNPEKIKISTPDGKGLLIIPHADNVFYVRVEPFRNEYHKAAEGIEASRQKAMETGEPVWTATQKTNMKKPGPDWVALHDLPDEIKEREDEQNVEVEWYLVDKQCNWWVIARVGGGSPHYHISAEAFSVRETDSMIERESVRVGMEPYTKVLHPAIHGMANILMDQVRERFREYHCDDRKHA